MYIYVLPRHTNSLAHQHQSRDTHDSINTKLHNSKETQQTNMFYIYRKFILLLTLAILATSHSMAAPAKRVWRTITLADGTTIEARLTGDEHGHWYIDRDGRTFDIDETGIGRQLSEAEHTAKQEIRAKRANQINQLRKERLRKNRERNTTHRLQSRAQSTQSIEQKGLVILVNFADKSMSSASINSSINRMFNEPGYSENNHVGSLKDYFNDQSYGKFNPTFDIVGPVTLSQPMSYYGGNDTSGNDKRPGEMVIEALKLADGSVNYKDYDWDGDGEVEQVLIVYAGYGENEGAPSSTIWPHEWMLSAAGHQGDGSGAQTLDGVKIDTYAVTNELAGTSGKRLTGIGTACHEFSHCLGLPDFYSTNSSNAAGMLYWSVMDMGSYNGITDNGEQPVEFTSYERWSVGWLIPTPLVKPCFIEDMPALCDEHVAYIIYNDRNKDEYYLLENKQSDKWCIVDDNGKQIGHGMMVLHVDYDEDIWWKNEVNNMPSHQRMTYIPADNTFIEYNSAYNYNVYTLSGDLFPGTRNVTELTDETTPAMTLYNKNTDGRYYMGKPITDIAESSDGKISFTFMGGIGTPEDIAVTDVTSEGFTVSWQSVENAQSYTVRAIPYSNSNLNEALLLRESFNKATKSNYALSSDDFDTYTDNYGWQGNNIYRDNQAFKLGASSKTGVLYSPAVSPKSGKLTMYISAIAHREGEEGATVSLINGNTGLTIDGTYDHIDFSASDTTVNVVTFDSCDPCKVCIIADKRIYITQIDLYDGAFTQEEIENSNNSKGKNGSKLYTQSAENGTVIVEGITDTKYTFSGLTAPQYKVSVQAVNSKKSSAWCDEEIVMLNTTGIENISLGTCHKEDSRIYTISGQYAGKETGKLPAGIYIRGGKKFLIK